MRKTKLTVVLDVDGVLADFVGATLDYLLAKHNLPLKYADITEWNIVDIPAIKPFKKEIHKVWSGKGFCGGLKVLPGTQEAVALLRRHADIKFATSPMASNPTWIRERNIWLKKNFDAVRSDITHTGKKSDVPGHFFVDDKPDNCVEYAGNVGAVMRDARVFLRLWPYNDKVVITDERIEVIERLSDIVKLVEQAWNLNSRPVKKTA